SPIRPRTGRPDAAGNIGFLRTTGPAGRYGSCVPRDEPCSVAVRNQQLRGDGAAYRMDGAADDTLTNSARIVDVRHDARPRRGRWRERASAGSNRGENAMA